MYKLKRRDLLSLSIGGLAGLTGCSLNSRIAAEHEFSLSPADAPSFECESHAFRLTGDTSRLKIAGRLPAIDQSCHDISAGVYWNQEGTALTAEIQVEGGGWFSECNEDPQPLYYTLTTSVGLNDYADFTIMHILGDEVQYRYDQEFEEMSLPVEGNDY